MSSRTLLSDHVYVCMYTRIYMYTHTHRSTRKLPLFLPYFEFSRHIFEISSNIKFHENPSSRSRVVQCGERDVTTLIVTFRNCSTAPKNLKHVGEYPNTGSNCEEFWLDKRRKFTFKEEEIISFFAKIDLPAPHFPNLIVHDSRCLSMSLSAYTAVKCEVITVWGQFVASSTTEHS